MSRIHVTYCSAAKRRDADPLPAARRYLDPRLDAVAAGAAAAGEGFLILSGEYGLLRPEDPIPWYDHLLRPDEAPELGVRAAARLRELGATEVVYHTADPGGEPQVAPYLEAIRRACEGAGTTLTVATLR